MSSLDSTIAMETIVLRTVLYRYSPPFEEKGRGLMMKSLAGIPSFREYLRERVERDQMRDMKLSKSLMDLLNGTPIMVPVLIGSTQLTCSEGEDKIRRKRYRGVGRHV